MKASKELIIELLGLIWNVELRGNMDFLRPDWKERDLEDIHEFSLSDILKNLDRFLMYEKNGMSGIEAKVWIGNIYVNFKKENEQIEFKWDLSLSMIEQEEETIKNLISAFNIGKGKKLSVYF